MRSEIRFIADQMLGRLAKWLRILGYDTLYLNPVVDSDLIGLSKREGRILLTRDTLLMKVREIRDGQITALLITDDEVRKQLEQVVTHFKLEERKRFSLCPECNHPLVEEKREIARHFIPRYVFQTQLEFFRCPRCNRFYWSGTHWRRIENRLKQLETSRSES